VQLRIKQVAPLLTRNREVIPHEAHYAQDRILGRRTLTVSGWAHPIEGVDRAGWTHSLLHGKEQPQQRCAQGQQPLCNSGREVVAVLL
jgi:hypothetical protein